MAYPPRSPEIASPRKTPIRPRDPTTNGSESAFQCLSASAASPTPGKSGRQFRPSSTETSVPFGPTVIQALLDCVISHR